MGAGVPVIDLSGRTVAEEVGRACEEIGFLTVVGHGVPEELVAETAAAGRAFFDRPEGRSARSPRASRRPGSRPTGRSAARASPRASARRRRAT